MSKIFLDANVLIDIIEHRNKKAADEFNAHSVYISVNSVAIWSYIYKVDALTYLEWGIFDQFNMIDLTERVVRKSFIGPTKDFEDNIQLHSAVQADADTFLTSDAALLKLGYFGNVRIAPTL